MQHLEATRAADAQPDRHRPFDGPFRFDRRRHARRTGGGAATAFVLDGDEFGRIVSLNLADSSEGGIGALSSEPIVPGVIVSLGFASSHHVAHRGLVTSCIPNGAGYRVGIRFEGRMAA